jgi:hypothetical protein
MNSIAQITSAAMRPQKSPVKKSFCLIAATTLLHALGQNLVNRVSRVKESLPL